MYFVYLPEYPRYKKLFYNNNNLKKIEEIINEIGLSLLI